MSSPYSYVQYTADGNTETYTVPFPYLEQSDVGVYINGIEQLAPSNYTWTDSGQIQFNGNVIASAVIEIKRQTNAASADVTFNNGAILTMADLNTAALQALYLAQEQLDAMNILLGTAAVQFTSGGVVSEPVDPTTMIQNVAAQILSSNLLTNLQQFQNDTDTNGQSIANNTLQLLSLGAMNDAGTAFILNTATAYVDDSTSLADQFASIQSSLDGNTASIEAQTTTLDGLSAQYTVKVDVNGYVSGFGLASTATDGTPTSDFIVLADSFSVVTPGSDPTVPFAITDGTVYMQNVVIQDALIDSLTLTKLTQGSLNADMNIGTGKIIWTNGAFMKVTGVGFGSSNQFLEWFGPYSTDYTTCTEGNATAYLKVDGSAYFGGTLLAGLLTNSVQATNLTDENVAILGPFSSNGGQITVTASYNFVGTGTIATTNGTQSSGPTPESPSAVIVLEESTGGGSFVEVATTTITGSYSEVFETTETIEGDVINTYAYTQTMAGSLTYVDNQDTTATRKFQLSISSWANVDSTVNTNTLSIQSVEA